jgi:hypothetical protein
MGGVRPYWVSVGPGVPEGAGPPGGNPLPDKVIQAAAAAKVWRSGHSAWTQGDPMIKRASFASLALLCTFAGHADEPQWLKDARARESKHVQAREFKSKDSWFKAKVPAKSVGAIEKAEGSYTVTLDIGGESPIYCEVVPDGFDMADMLRRTLDITMTQVEETQGKVEMRAIERVDAGAYGAVPYLATSWIYRVNDGKAPRVGGLKQISMSKNGHGMYCAHVDLGYAKTFEAVAKGLAETLETSGPAPAPYYQEIATATLGGMKVGVLVSTLERDADGDTKAEQVTSMLLPGLEGAVQSQDTIQKEFIRPDASMINAISVNSSNGELTINLALKSKDDVWVIEGDVQGKAVSERLKSDAEPGTWVAQALGIRKLLANADALGKEHSIPMWVSADPVKLTDARTKVVAKVDDGRYSGVGTIGAIVGSLTIDKASGMTIDASFQIGAQIVKMERVYVSGSF